METASSDWFPRLTKLIQLRRAVRSLVVIVGVALGVGYVAAIQTFVL